MEGECRTGETGLNFLCRIYSCVLAVSLNFPSSVKMPTQGDYIFLGTRAILGMPSSRMAFQFIDLKAEGRDSQVETIGMLLLVGHLSSHREESWRKRIYKILPFVSLGIGVERNQTIRNSIE